MNHPIRNVRTLPKGMLLFLAFNAISLPVFLAEHAALHKAVIEEWIALAPALVWKGQIWRLVSYAVAGASVLPWAVNLFWMVTLTSLLARDWSTAKHLIYCATAAIGGALPIALLDPHGEMAVIGGGAIVFGLLVAWDRLYHRERIMMLGIGEVSVRQAAIFIGAINGAIAFFSCGGLLITLSLFCGAAVGWVYLAATSKAAFSRGSQRVESERMARLEL